MMEKITVIKVGGAVVEDEAQLTQLLQDFSAIEGRKVLVHGGGRRATKVAAQLGIETQMVNGRRITDASMLEVVTMVYGGLVNKNVVARLQAQGIDALGLTGADIDVIRSHKRPLKNGVDYGFVGDVDRADGDKLHTLIEAGIVPVMAPLTHDGMGNILNTNADGMLQAYHAYRALAGKDENCGKYIETYAGTKAPSSTPSASPSAAPAALQTDPLSAASAPPCSGLNSACQRNILNISAPTDTTQNASTQIHRVCLMSWAKLAQSIPRNAKNTNTPARANESAILRIFLLSAFIRGQS